MQKSTCMQEIHLWKVDNIFENTMKTVLCRYKNRCFVKKKKNKHNSNNMSAYFYVCKYLPSIITDM